MVYTAMLEEYRSENARIDRFETKTATLLIFNAGALVLLTEIQLRLLVVHVVIAVFVALVSGLYALYPSTRFHRLNIDHLISKDVMQASANDLAESLTKAVHKAIVKSREALRLRENAIRVCTFSTGIAVSLALIGWIVELF